MIEWAGTISMVIAISGVVLNNYQKRACFVVWLVSNSISLAVHLVVGPWSFVARDLVFILLAVHGWFTWKRKHKKQVPRIKNENEKGS
jgi:nicotinamide riboside transporter PnuC